MAYPLIHSFPAWEVLLPSSRHLPSPLQLRACTCQTERSSHKSNVAIPCDRSLLCRSESFIPTTSHSHSRQFHGLVNHGQSIVEQKKSIIYNDTDDSRIKVPGECGGYRRKSREPFLPSLPLPGSGPVSMVGMPCWSLSAFWVHRRVSYQLAFPLGLEGLHDIGETFEFDAATQTEGE